MYPYIYEELAWAIAREREEEARKTRPCPEPVGLPGCRFARIWRDIWCMQESTWTARPESPR